MKIQKKIELTLLQRPNSRKFIDVVQYDTGVRLVCAVTDFTIPEGTTATLYVQKPSGKFVYQETGISVSGNTVTIDLENQALAEHGDTYYQIQLVNGEDAISTFAGIIRVAKSYADAGAEESKTVISAFDEKTAEIIAEIENAYVGNAVSLKPDERIVDDAELETLLEQIYSEMGGAQTKLVYWTGFPSTTSHGWFGILSKSSDSNGRITAWSANRSGSAIFKTKFSGVWKPLEWENPPMTENVEYRTTERVHEEAVYKMMDSKGDVTCWLGGGSLTEYINTRGVIGCGRESKYPMGVDYNSTSVDGSYVRSDYIPVSNGDSITYSNLKCPANYAVVTVYDKLKAARYCKPGISTDYFVSGTVKITEDGYIRLSTRAANLGVAVVELRKKEWNAAQKKTLNILSIGNSYSQDCFGYLPAVLNEILPDYCITYGNAYQGSTALMDQANDHIPNKTPYTWFNYWDSSAEKWDRQTGKIFEQIMAMKRWDIIYLQPDGDLSTPENIDERIVTPGRTVLRWLQNLNGGHFSLMLGQRFAVPDTSIDTLIPGMETACKKLGCLGYAPIGTAFQNARTNSTLNALGEDKKGWGYGMLYDNHMQAGIPALLAAYTIALKILEYIGESHRGIYGSTFVPTREKCISIGAYMEEGMDGDHLPMTHGEPVGVTTENIRAAQEIAVLAVNNPTEITDCSGIIV